MGLINQTGYYKGVIIDGGLGQSSGGFPQEVWMLKAAEVYDPDAQEYLPVDAEHDEITAYLILISSKNKETKTAQQVKKVTGWDGASFVDLANMDLADVGLSFRVEENTYEGNTSLQVAWVDVPDATPGRTVVKLGKDEVAALQARYASVLATTKAPVKPVSAKGKKAAAAKPKAAAKRPTVPKVATPKTTKPVGKCSADDAYNECYALKRDDVTEDALNELWQTEVAKVNEDESKIAEEQWFQIKETILKQIGKV
jgi:hypothetical protein